MSRRRSQLGKPALILATVLAVAATIFGAYRTTHAAGGAFVRVNQMGYATGATKRAYLMASGAETGATFSVTNASGTTVYSAAIGANLGSWSSAYPEGY
jgi:endoglucanase